MYLMRLHASLMAKCFQDSDKPPFVQTVLESLPSLDTDHWNFILERRTSCRIIQDIHFSQCKFIPFLQSRQLLSYLRAKTATGFGIDHDSRHAHESPWTLNPAANVLILELRRENGQDRSPVESREIDGFDLILADSDAINIILVSTMTVPEGIQGRVLNGQVALVTGAGRRIGREIALTLGRSGASVIVNYNRSRPEALATVRDIKAYGVDSLALQADVARPVQVRRMFCAVQERFGRLDLLVNNAGIFFRERWDRLTEKQWDQILNVNLKGPFFCAQEAARLMQHQRSGQIINISSLGGLQAWPDSMHYCSSKSGLIMLTRCLAKALAPRIRVNSIAPGMILFPGEQRSRVMESVIRSTPLRRAGGAKDIAQMVLHVACDSDFITGQIFPVDGGKSIP